MAPDLSRTKVCQNFAKTGICTEKDCPFAHNRSELRTMRLSHFAQSNLRMGLARASSKEVNTCQADSAGTDTLSPPPPPLWRGANADANQQVFDKPGGLTSLP